jgi:hypothetical protein
MTVRAIRFDERIRSRKNATMIYEGVLMVAAAKSVLMTVMTIVIVPTTKARMYLRICMMFFMVYRFHIH